MNWRMCKPLSFQDMMESEIINYGYDPYQHIEFTFNRDQVITAIQRFIDEVRNLLGNEPQRFGWPVQGFDVEKLLSIDLLNP
jgi:hypothetical protein